MSGKGAEILIVAGEASGDLHGSRLLHELKALAPSTRVFGMGGDLMVAEGLERLADSREIAVIGLAEALKVVPRARRILGDLVRAARVRRPAAAVLIDSPDFNLPLAKRLHRHGIPVVYYVSPQIWAWREGRVRTIARCVDRMLVLFGFEVDFYRRHGIGVEHVGHPLVDEVEPLAQAWDSTPRDASQPLRLALLPGSRGSEIDALLPTMLEAARLLQGGRPWTVRLIVAPGLERERLESHTRGSGVELEWVVTGRHEAIADSHLALCASGTATLEVGLLRTPMLVLYRLNPLTYRLARRLVRVPHIALVNLVLGERVVPELVQHEADPPAIAAAVSGLLADPAGIERTREALAGLRAALGESGASRRAAAAVVRCLEGPSGGAGEQPCTA